MNLARRLARVGELVFATCAGRWHGGSGEGSTTTNGQTLRHQFAGAKAKVKSRIITMSHSLL